MAGTERRELGGTSWILSGSELVAMGTIPKDRGIAGVVQSVLENSPLPRRFPLRGQRSRLWL